MIKAIGTTLLLAGFAFGQHSFVHLAPTRDAAVDHSASHKISSFAATDGNGIDYHGGPVLLGTPTVYVIWYGNWTTASPAIPIVTDFLGVIGGSPYERINAGYHDGFGNYISGSVAYGGAVYDNYSRGSSLTDTDVQLIVLSHFGVDLPVDLNAVYFVMTSTGVSVTFTGTLGTTFCAYHNWTAYQTLSNRIKYALVGDTSAFPRACQFQKVGPNGSSGGDGMTNMVAHELEESINDWEEDAWYDSFGNESADKCDWVVMGTFKVSKNIVANMTLGSRNYMIQPNWENSGGGFCGLK